MTETKHMTLTEFLLARIEDDEAVARATAESSDALDWHENPAPHILDLRAAVGLEGPVDGPSGYHSVIINPDRVLADCAARRAIVDLATNQHTSGPEYDEVVRHLAAVYADHPDYLNEWRP